MLLVFRAQARLRDCLASHHGIAETLSIRRAFHWKLSSSPKGSHSTQQGAKATSYTWEYIF